MSISKATLHDTEKGREGITKRKVTFEITGLGDNFQNLINKAQGVAKYIQGEFKVETIHYFTQKHPAWITDTNGEIVAMAYGIADAKFTFYGDSAGLAAQVFFNRLIA